MCVITRRNTPGILLRSSIFCGTGGESDHRPKPWREKGSRTEIDKWQTDNWPSSVNILNITEAAVKKVTKV